jgi:hypothetical protein
MLTIREHLLSRHLDLELHGPVIDEVGRTATFFLWNLSGQAVGYQRYRPDAAKRKDNDPVLARYYNYRTQGTMIAWGVESLGLTPHVVFLTEGVFDAARLTRRGYSALAALTNDPGVDFRNWLGLLNRRVVAVCDNDAAGHRLARYGTQAVVVPDRDLGDAPESYVDHLIKTHG